MRLALPTPASSSTISRVSPPLFGEVSTLTPTLTWANSNAAVFYYEVQVSRDFEFGPNAFLYSEYVHGGATTPGGGSGGGGGRGRSTPTPTPTPSPTPTATPTPTGPQFSGQIVAELSVSATVVPEGTTLGLNGGGDLPGGVYVNFPPTAVALPVHVSVSVSNEAPSDEEAPSGTTLLPLTIDITPATPLTPSPSISSAATRSMSAFSLG